MFVSLAVLTLALATAPAPAPVAPAQVSAQIEPANPQSAQPAAPAPSRSAFGAAIAEMTHTLQAQAAAERAAADAPPTRGPSTAALARDD